MEKYKKGVAFGTWDCLHFGHIDFLEEAKNMCEELTVAVDTDKYAFEKKNKETYNDFWKRSRHLTSLGQVDKISIQHKDFQKRDYINKFKPNVIFVGTDHRNNGWEGEKIAGEFGIDVVFIDEAVIHSADIRKIIKEKE